VSADELVAAITGTVDYLRVSVGVGRDAGEWFPCEPLVGDPEHLAAVVATTKAGRGTDRDDVAVSLFVQGYAFRIASLAIGAWVLGDEVLDLAPRTTAIAIGRDRPNGVRVDAATTTAPATLDHLHESLVDEHLGRLVANARAAGRVGGPLLWGNVAASCASSFGAFAGELPERAVEIRDRAEQFFAAARPEVAGAGDLVRVGDRRCAWERKSCCLWYLTERGFLCEDCSLHTDADRHARYAAALAEEAGG
jgi:ferric iron reductase protein FhuF